MNSLQRILLGGTTAALFVVWLPQRASATCTSNQSDAVDCFIKDAVSTKLLDLPAGMTMSQFEAYGVAVSNIVQSENDAMMLVGTMSAVADAMPPTNANGTANQTAQDTAVNSMVEAALNNLLITLPPSTTTTQMQQFARQLAANMSPTNEVSLSPGILLRMIDSYIVSATSNGTVNWTQVDTSLSSAIASLTSSGIIRIPSGMQPAQLQQFAEQVAQAIYTYKTATGRTGL